MHVPAAAFCGWISAHYIHNNNDKEKEEKEDKKF